MEGLIILVFIYIAGGLLGLVITNPDLDYYAEEKQRKYFKGFHIFIAILFFLIIASSMTAGY